MTLNNRASSQGVAPQLTQWADQLRAIAARGGHFANNIYDKENYHRIQEIAQGLLAIATGDSLETFEPFAAPVLRQGTAFSVCDAAVINDAGEILLIQRADNQMWAMPGGILDVGESPAAGASREVLEETGVTCEPVALIGVYDSLQLGTVSRHQLYHVTFLCAPLTDVALQAIVTQDEILATGWFTEDQLPAELDPSHGPRIPTAFRFWHGERSAVFD